MKAGFTAGGVSRAVLATLAAGALAVLVLASFRAGRVWRLRSAEDPAILVSEALMRQVDDGVNAIYDRIGLERPLDDLDRVAARKLMDARRREPVEVAPEPALAVEAPFRLHGIVWMSRKPLVLVDERLVGLGDVVQGWRVADIREDRVVFLDPQNRRRTMPLYQERSP